jgi:putative nucleotidyltransferase with HDIG domain
MFVAAAGIVLYLFPRAGKFKYEYAKGRFWKHGVLISSFDFPINKSPQQIALEKDSIQKNFRPYFVKDTLLGLHETARFISDFETNMPSYKMGFTFLRNAQSQGFPVLDRIEKFVVTQLKQTYSSGIILLPDEYKDAPVSFEFKVIHGNMAYPYGLFEVYTLKSAYQKVFQDLSLSLSDSLRYSVRPSTEELNNFISQLQLNKYLKANLTIDKSRTDVERENLFRDMMPTSGAIKAGQRIIGPGEMIDEHMIQVLDSYKYAFENRLGSTEGYSQILLGQLLIALSFFAGVYLFLYFFRNDIFQNNKSVSFILLLMVSMITLARVSSSFFYIPIFVIPFALLPITIRTFFDSRLALFIHIITILLSSFFAQNSFQFIFLQIPAGITAIFGLVRIERRSQLVIVSVIIAMVYSLLYTALFLWQEGDITKIEPIAYARFGANGALLMLTYLAIYIFEKIFGFLSDVTLAELSNTNHPLLLQLAERTPGTFHHSIQVGNLAVPAVKKIGGNPLLVYAGAMYHDIGKMEAPSIFIENQISGVNPLQSIDYEQGAQLVIGHIENGVRLAKKHKLPKQIIDFIITHQGTTKAKYFYNSFVNENPDKIPDISAFSYPGPTPFSKETAVLMMADAIEAASRSLNNYTDNEIDKLVERIINDQMEQGQFNNAPITLKEISDVKEIFKRRIKIIYHSRISYPEIKKA